MFIYYYGMVRVNSFLFLIHLFSFICSMEGGELFNRIRSRHDRPYTEREAANIILMIAKAVTHLHHMDMVKKRFYFLFRYRF